MSDYSDRQLVAGEMVGYRSFRMVDTRGAALYGPFTVLPFEPGVNTATCIRSDLLHEKDGTWKSVKLCEGFLTTACSCGFYARTRLTQPDHWKMWDEKYNRPIGAVKAWGKIVAGDVGFRAEHMQLVAIYTKTKWLKPIAEMYQVPAFSDSDLMLVKFPPTQLVNDDQSRST